MPLLVRETLHLIARAPLWKGIMCICLLLAKLHFITRAHLWKGNICSCLLMRKLHTLLVELLFVPLLVARDTVHLITRAPCLEGYYVTLLVARENCTPHCYGPILEGYLLVVLVHTFMSMIHAYTISESLETREFFIFQRFIFYEQWKFHAQLS